MRREILGDEMQSIEIDKLLAKTDAFINTMYYVKDDFSLLPEKKHIGTCIRYLDLQEMREEFIEEMVYSVVEYVYSADKQIRLVDKFTKEGRETSGAYEKLSTMAKKKFRKDFLQGQFSELLLFNLLQYHFKAAPLLRKMPITTNPNLERNGADAFHISKKNGKYRLYLGEAKTYNRKKYSLKSALNDAIDSILEHYLNHRKEFNLYTFEDFIPKELEKIAEDYKNGTLKEIEVHLVCMITYDNKKQINGSNSDELLAAEIQSIREETNKIKKDIFNNIPPNLLPRFNYVMFPIKEMDDLINLFQKYLGI